MEKDNLLLIFQENEIKFLITEAINNKFQLFAIDNDGKYYLLKTVQLRDILSHHPNKAEVYFQIGPTSFDSKWDRVGFDGLYGDKNQGRILLQAAGIGSEKTIHLNKNSALKKKLPQHIAREENNKDRFIALLLHDYHKSKQAILGRGISALSTSYEQLARTINIKLSDSTIETLIKTAINHLPDEKKT